MPAWGQFFFAVAILVVLIVALTRASQRAIEATPAGEARVQQGSVLGDEPDEDPPVRTLSTGELYANVVVSHGLFAAVLAGLLWWFDVPTLAVGIDLGAFTGPTLAPIGVASGLGLYVLNEASIHALDRFDIEYSEELRRALAPRSALGWGLLLVVVLPIIAGFEELLFRGVLIGALGAATGISPWLLAIGSSVIFAVGHGIQGQGGVIVTGSLGFLLAGIFILTESLLVVIVAHYVVNALEFTIHEGLRAPIADHAAT